MDFENQNSDLKSTENFVPDTPIGDVKIESNGSNANEDDNDDLRTNENACSDNRNGEGVELNCDNHENVDLATADSQIDSETKGDEGDLEETDSCVSPSEMLSPTSGTKGQGLRKWRRIKREAIDNGTHSEDSANGLEDLANPKARVEMKQISDGSESSVNGILHKVAGSFTGSDEDRDSKSSSTAASIPKPRNVIPRPPRAKDKGNHMGGKHSSDGLQHMNQDVGDLGASKKLRGEAVSIYSHSSRESDSGSYSYGFMHCLPNGGNDRGTRDSEQHSDEEVPTGVGKSAEDQEISKGGSALSWKVKNDRMLGNWDPLVDCVQRLQFTQEALEREIHKFSEVGTDHRTFDNVLSRTSSIGPESCVPSSTGSPTSDFGTDIPDVLLSLTKNIYVYEKQIEETKGTLKAKETEIAHLQATVNSLMLSNEDLLSSIYIQQKNYEEIEAEVETLCKEKMEAEIKYLAVADVSFVAENQMKFLLTGQKSLVSEHEQVQDSRKVENIEFKAAKLEETKVTFVKGIIFFVIMLILFIYVFDLFVSKLLSNTTAVLPT